MSRFLLNGQVAIVTGGGTGIGRGIALVLAEHGADVVLAGRRREPLESTAGEVEALGRRAVVVPTDVTDVADCENLVRQTVAVFGRLDILVNNAGGAVTKPISDWTPEEWHQVIDLNIGSVWFLSRFAANPMRTQGRGAIVNISSGSSFFAFPMGAPYGASKAAVNNLTMSMAAAWTPSGIRVNGVACGAVRTELLLEDAKKHGIEETSLAAGNGMVRLGEPHEIGYAVLFFASDAASYCSGQTLWINGGPRG
ncbi:short chain dehydrogenase/reductase SDR [Mycolicibacterium flavescens]|uniref:SDR family NAD(P)-dependent oxidoreductase n=1 Tax=Mycobacterium neumannii TaxID=2048551 RepID=UPI000B942240|nr:SDR family oxidoreductase [Mycobacterium neumannii]VEG43627.1 short chain dehydrogenase/reductase SDR [Mycolicibacterium flavescens]